MKCIDCETDMKVTRDYVDSLTGRPMSVWVCPNCRKIELKEAK
jgi:hypothetical protein